MNTPISNLILYKNNHFIALNKPPGLPVQPDLTKDKSLLDLAEIYCQSKLFLIHRIDRPVSGLVLLGKTKTATLKLARQFKTRQTGKIYLAVVKNHPPKNEDQLKHYLTKNTRLNRSFASEKKSKNAKEALLHYSVWGSIDHYHLLKIKLLTGRHHQIRSQLSAINSPIKGDTKYGAQRNNPDRSIHLHAWKLLFNHPANNEPICLVAPLPVDPVWEAFQLKFKELKE